jgi:hypothetical protein
MKNIKKFENFDGFAADEEADQMKLDQAFDERDAQDAQDTMNSEENLQNEGESVDILARFEEEFGDNKPSNQEVMEFYHKLRTEGVDGIEIFDTLLSNNKIGEGDDDDYDPENDEDFGAMRADGSDNLGNEDDFGYASHDGSFDGDDSEEDEEHYERQSLKRFNNFK